MTGRAQGVARLAAALGVGVASTSTIAASPVPRCPSGEGNPIAFTVPTTITAGIPGIARIRADLSERIEVDLVTATGKRVLSRATDRDLIQMDIGTLAAGTYRLRARAAFTYPVPETGELGLCLRVGGRVLTVRAR